MGRLDSLAPGKYTVNIHETFSRLGSPQGETFFSLEFEVAPSSFYISPGMTGSWYNPEQSGHGLSLEFFADDRVIGYWYTFDLNGEPAWLIMDGKYFATGAELKAFTAAGGVFPPLFDAENVELSHWGDVALSFADCTSGNISWTTSDELFTSGELDIKKLSPAVGLPCRGVSNTFNEDTFLPVVRYSQSDDFVLYTDETWGVPNDFQISLESLPDEFNVPDHLGIDRALRVTGSTGKLTLLTDFWSIIDWQDYESNLMLELVLRVATKQRSGCTVDNQLGFKLFSLRPRVRTISEAFSDEVLEMNVVSFGDNEASGRIQLSSPLLAPSEEGNNCEEGPLEELTLRSSSGEAVFEADRWVGIQIEAFDNSLAPIDFYIIEATLNAWKVVKPPAGSRLIPESSD